jgi:hypothetical protein
MVSASCWQRAFGAPPEVMHDGVNVVLQCYSSAHCCTLFISAALRLQLQFATLVNADPAHGDCVALVTASGRLTCSCFKQA